MIGIIDLPDPAAARAFAFDEPNYQAGVCHDVLLRRWRTMAGRTMWDFPGGSAGDDRYPARTLLSPDLYADIEVHNWQFGGRR